MNKQDFRFFHRLRVRWAEVDMQKIVFNAHYLMYVDTAISDYWRALALPYEEAMHQLGGDLYVKKSSLEYHASARFDDQLDVGMRCSRIGNSSMLFEAGIFRGEELLISAELVYVFADPTTQKSRAVPELLRNALLSFEAGDPVVQVHTGPWEALGEAALRLRVEVFVEEQRIPLEMERDPADEHCLHAVATNRLGQVVATGRLLPSQNGRARVGRMAVKRLLRGVGLGQRVLSTMVEAARQRGDQHLVLHAQRSAEAFYARAGFVAQGDGFEEDGLPHIEMVRAL